MASLFVRTFIKIESSATQNTAQFDEMFVVNSVEKLTIGF